MPDLPAIDHKLAIVVPYRDRAEHLAAFVPHMRTYFERHPVDYSIHIVEQAGTGPFNRGALKNVGFDLSKALADYVCFHDIDYLPVDADYSYPDKPTRLIWHGLRVTEDYERFWGGVILFRREHFQAVNGYSNGYRGWGFEDIELRLRCDFAGVGRAYRDGTYTGLAHVHSGLRPDGNWTEEAAANKARFDDKRPDLVDGYLSEGLNSLNYRVLDSAPLVLGGATWPNIFRHLVEIEDLPLTP